MLVAGARNQSCAREPTMGAAEGNGTGRMHGGRAAAATFIIAPCSTGAMQEAAAKRHVIFLGCCSGQQRTHTLCSRHLAITMRADSPEITGAAAAASKTDKLLRPGYTAFK
jgi:hypothetical protein